MGDAAGKRGPARSPRSEEQPDSLWALLKAEPYLLVLLATPLVCYALLRLGWPSIGEGFEPGEYGSFGDAVAPAGILISGVALLYTALAVKGQSATSRLQAQSIELQAAELALQRTELSDTRAVLRSQADQLALQVKALEASARAGGSQADAARAQTAAVEAESVRRRRRAEREPYERFLAHSRAELSAFEVLLEVWRDLVKQPGSFTGASLLSALENTVHAGRGVAERPALTLPGASENDIVLVLSGLASCRRACMKRIVLVSMGNVFTASYIAETLVPDLSAVQEVRSATDRLETALRKHELLDA